jgi:hypothetical protein
MRRLLIATIHLGNTGPDLRGVRGIGVEIGAVLSVGERPRSYRKNGCDSINI